jgi:hypothetical protein
MTDTFVTSLPVPAVEAHAVHAEGLLDAVLVVDDELLRQDMDHLAIHRDGDGLGGVDGAPTAEGDQDVGAECAVLREAVPDVDVGGVRLNLGKDVHRDVGVGERSRDAAGQTVRGEERVGDEQRPTGAEPAHLRRQLRQRPVADHDGCGDIERDRHTATPRRGQVRVSRGRVRPGGAGFAPRCGTTACTIDRDVGGCQHAEGGLMRASSVASAPGGTSPS